MRSQVVLVRSFLWALLILLIGGVDQMRAEDSGVPLPKGVYAKWGAAAGRIPKQIQQNPGIVAVQIGIPWNAIESSDGAFDWSVLDARIEEARQARLKVMLSILTSLTYAPDYIKKNPQVQTIAILDTREFPNAHCEPVSVPLYWDPIYHARKLRLIHEAGTRYKSSPVVVGINIGVANFTWNEMRVPHFKGVDRRCGSEKIDQENQWLQAGYTTRKMLAEGEETLDAAAEAFPRQALTFSVQATSSRLDGSETALAEGYLDYVDRKPYSRRFYPAIDFLKTNTPKGNSDKVANATPGSFEYLYRLLMLREPNVGLEMVDAASLGAKNHCRQNGDRSPCPAIEVLRDSVQAALSYHPVFLRLWSVDSKDDKLTSTVEEATLAMGGKLRDSGLVRSTVELP